MKKLLVSLVAAALMALGFVGMSSSPAHADCGYQGCIPTRVKTGQAAKHVKKGTKPKFDIGVKAVGGQGDAKGTVTVTCTSPDGEHTKSGSAPVKDGNAGVDFDKPLRQKGTWTCKAVFEGKDPFRRSSSTFSVTVG